MYESLVYLNNGSLDAEDLYNLSTHIINSEKVDSSIRFILVNRTVWFFSDEYQELKNLSKLLIHNNQDLLLPVILTDKKFLNFLFESNFSDNLLELHLGGDIDDKFDSMNLYGSSINNSYEFYKLMEYDEVTVTFAKLQRLHKDEVLTLSHHNNCKFSKHMKKDQIYEALSGLSEKILQYYLKDVVHNENYIYYSD